MDRYKLLMQTLDNLKAAFGIGRNYLNPKCIRPDEKEKYTRDRKKKYTIRVLQ